MKDKSPRTSTIKLINKPSQALLVESYELKKYNDTTMRSMGLACTVGALVFASLAYISGDFSPSIEIVSGSISIFIAANGIGGIIYGLKTDKNINQIKKDALLAQGHTLN